ncbi:hypothetical protein UFOVP147_27 [uncultured Caudovirales phage]|uniref:Uncharacterized protein n=1 Tax=uncultured Caudovirales phage TaxID=2100421 RepID=A0A6J7W920_9CAUD|nr:hypothetical protein UFOVP147_27 [uncultured Caudovirales phage]
MSFVGKWISSLASGLGLVDTPAVPPAPPPPPIAPTASNSQDAMDLSAQRQAASMQGGRTSTMLNGAAGVDDAKNTSKVLLGR